MQRPMPMAAPAETQVEIDGEEIVVTIWAAHAPRAESAKCTSRGKMQVNVKVSGQERARRIPLSRRYTFDVEMSLRRAAFTSSRQLTNSPQKEETIHREVGVSCGRCSRTCSANTCERR